VTERTEEAQVDDGSQLLQQVLFFALLLFGFYLLAIRPQRARAKAMAEVRSGLQVGSRVMTTAGIHGTVVAISTSDGAAEGADPALADTVLLEVAKGVHVRFATPAVVRILDGAAPAGHGSEPAT
jgi:preprotein translocase subunit YajC